MLRVLLFSFTLNGLKSLSITVGNITLSLATAVSVSVYKLTNILINQIIAITVTVDKIAKIAKTSSFNNFFITLITPFHILVYFVLVS